MNTAPEPNPHVVDTRLRRILRIFTRRSLLRKPVDSSLARALNREMQKELKKLPEPDYAYFQ